MTAATFGRVVLMYSASMNVPHYWTADQVKLLGDSVIASAIPD